MRVPLGQWPLEPRNLFRRTPTPESPYTQAQRQTLLLTLRVAEPLESQNLLLLLQEIRGRMQLIMTTPLVSVVSAKDQTRFRETGGKNESPKEKYGKRLERTHTVEICLKEMKIRENMATISINIRTTYKIERISVDF